MKKKLCLFLILILIPCTLFAQKTLSVAEIISNLIIDLLEKEAEPKNAELPTRSQIKEEDKWDLTSIYASEEDFLADIERLKNIITQADSYKDILDTSKENLLKVLTWYYEGAELADKIYYYVLINRDIDITDYEASQKYDYAYQYIEDFDIAYMFVNSEILEAKNIETFIADDPKFDDYRFDIIKILRKKEHRLDENLEGLLLKQTRFTNVFEDTYNILTSSELKFEDVNGQPFNALTFGNFLKNPNREIRKEAYLKYFKAYDDLKQTFASLYNGYVQSFVFNSNIRGYETSLESNLFEDNIDESVYFNLIDTIHEALPSLHRYYEIKRRALGLERIGLYDMRIPIVEDVDLNIPYERAVEMVIQSLSPLGEEYTSTMEKGLTTDRWVDKYPHIGKSTGAYSYFIYNGNPVISMNHTNKITDVYTMAHEGGHSMHTWYSKRNSYATFDYTSLHAEVASLFNEQFLNNYLINNAKTDKEKAYYLLSQIDNTINLIFSQTRLAEFQLKCHQLVEQGNTLSANTLMSIYKELQEQYYGPNVEIPEEAQLGCFTVPHLYYGFYVYQYAIDYCAAAALSEMVLNGGEEELNAYLDFLENGASMFPLDAIKKAGVDMSSPEPIKVCIDKFNDLLDELEALLFKLN